MTLPPAHRLPLLVMAVIAVALGAYQWQVAQSLHDGLSPIANAYSESNAIRAGESFAVRGFTYAWGLPDIIYGSQFADIGDKPKAKPGQTEYIYTHYPPGPDWVAGVGTEIFGVGRVSRMRIIPIMLGVAGLLVFAWGLSRFFPDRPWCAVVAFGVTMLFPMSTNMMHGLHHHGYDTTLYFVQLAVLLAATAEGFRVQRWHMAVLLALGFLQGWLAFDNFPIVAFSSIPFSIAWWHRRAPGTTWREHALILALPIAGYVTAHGIHFLQISAYLGGLRAGFQDLAGAAAYRSGAEDAKLSTQGTLYLLWRYMVEWVPRNRFFGTPLLENLAIFVLLTAASRLWLQRGSRSVQRRVSLDIRWDALAAALAALFVGAFWVLVMTNHAALHGNYIPRNFLLAYLIPLYVIIDGIRFPLHSRG